MRGLRIVIVALALLVLLAAGLQAAPSPQARSLFGWIVASRLTVNNNSDLRGDVDVGDDLTVTGDGAIDTNLTVGSLFGTTPQTAVAVTMAGNITPTGTYVQLSSAGTVGTSAIVTTSLVSGQQLVFVNTTNTTITISDTGILKLSGNAVLGQYDNLTVIYDGTNLIELAQGDN